MPKLSSRKEFATYAQQQKEKFAPLLNKGVTVVFGKHEVKDTLKDVKLARLGDIANQPDKRKNGDAQYTPSCLEMDFEGGQLFFVIEDINAIQTTLSGILMDMSPGPSILFKEAS